MLAVEILVTIAVAKMVAQKIAEYSLAPLKVYCCSLFCTFRDDLKDLEKELLCLEAQLKEKDKWLFGIEVADEGQAVLAQSWYRDAKQLAFEIEDIIDEFVCSEELYHGSICVHKAPLEKSRSSFSSNKSTTGAISDEETADTAGAAGPSISSLSQPADLVEKHASSSVEYQPCERAVQYQCGCQDSDGTNGDVRKAERQ